MTRFNDAFEDTFLTISDVDETLIEKDDNGVYKDPDVQIWFWWFSKGFTINHKLYPLDKYMRKDE